MIPSKIGWWLGDNWYWEILAVSVLFPFSPIGKYSHPVLTSLSLMLKETMHARYEEATPNQSGAFPF